MLSRQIYERHTIWNMVDVIKTDIRETYDMASTITPVIQ